VRGLIVDYGGVMTTDVFASFRAFCEAEGLAPDTVRDRFFGDVSARALLERLETGRAAEPEFEAAFSQLLGVAPDGLIDRMFGHMAPDDAMIEGVLAARRAGVRTAMLSNSWGEDRYDLAELERLFDTWVISGLEGVRKPDPAIYALAARRLDLPAETILHVGDSWERDVVPAHAVGMRTAWLARPEVTTPVEPAGVWRLSSLLDLEALLA